MGFGAVAAVLCWRRDLAASRPGPLAAGLVAGLLMLAGSAALWLTAARPQILILRQAGIVLNLLMLLVAGLGLIAHALF